MAQEQPEGELRGVGRVLKLLADVKAGEAGIALLMLANLFLLLVAYYVLKTVREPLILSTAGAKVKSYAAAGQALLLMGFIPLYDWLAARLDRMKLITVVLVFFVVNIEMFHFAGLADLPYVGVVFYIWVGIFNLASVAQFWSFAADIYHHGAGARLFPLIAIGATAGSPVGAAMAEGLFKRGANPFDMLHLSAAILVVHLGLYWLVAWQGARGKVRLEPASEKLSGPGGFLLVLRNPYLRWAALVFILLNIVKTNGEYIISRMALEAAKVATAHDPSVSVNSFLGAFYGEYFFYVNVLTLLIQAFVVSRIVKHFGFAGVMLALPLVAFGTYGLVALGAGTLLTISLKTAESSTDYSVMNTGRQMLWLPTSRDEKYKGKQAIDTFFTRAGDVLSAALVYAGTTWLGFEVTGFAAANLVVIALWIGVVFIVLKKYRLLTLDQEESKPVPLPDAVPASELT